MPDRVAPPPPAVVPSMFCPLQASGNQSQGLPSVSGHTTNAGAVAASLRAPANCFNMTIVYALIARGKAVLAEFTATAGNFPTVTRVLLNKIPAEATRMSYVSVRGVLQELQQQ